MRYCLACRHLTSSGPICSQCGRSFGGNLCPHGHLNPPGAQFCSQCGSTKLLQAASFFSFGSLLRWLLLLGLVWAGYEWWPTLRSSHWGDGLQHRFSALYEWLLLKAVVLGIFLFLCWIFGDLFSPRIRRGIERIVASLFLLLFKIIEVAFTSLFRALVKVLGGKVGK